jgi:arginase
MSSTRGRAPRIRRPLEIVEAPSNLGLRPPAPGRQPGVRRMPEALRAAGLHARLAPAAVCRVEPPPYSFDLDPRLGVRNARAIRDYSGRLADAIGAALDRAAFPLVLGGDCSILIGAMLALRRRGRFGLLFADGHTDFGTPATSGTGGAAGMDLAIVCGVGLPLLTEVGGTPPLVRDEDVVAFGFRDVDDRGSYPWREVFETRIAMVALARVREVGIEGAVGSALAHLAGRGVAGFWLHVDVDVLDSRLFPAVDSPQPDGLTLEELSVLVRLACGSPLCAGAEVAIYDPDLDPDGGHGRALADSIAAGLSVGG